VNLRLAYSTNAYTRFDLSEALTRVANLGYAGVELMADAPHLWPAETSKEQSLAVRRALDRLGLTISNVNAFMMNRVGDPRHPYWYPSWIESDAGRRRIRAEHTKAALSMARELGAPHITTEPGGPLEENMKHRTGMERFIEALKPMVEHAERTGVALLVEPEPGLLIERFEQYLELAERIDSPFLGLNFDVGHAFCVGQQPEDWVAQMAAHTRHYHLEDIAASRVHRHLVPGEGAIDFGATLRAIERSGYSGWLTVELYPYVDDPDGAGTAAKRHLERNAAGQ